MIEAYHYTMADHDSDSASGSNNVHEIRKSMHKTDGSLFVVLVEYYFWELAVERVTGAVITRDPFH